MITTIFDAFCGLLDKLDDSLEETPAHQIILGTLLLGYAYFQYPVLLRAYRARHSKTIGQRFLDGAFALAEHLPLLNQYVNGMINQNLRTTREKLRIERASMLLQETLPYEGKTPTEILKAFDIDVQTCLFDFQSVNTHDSARSFIIQEGDGLDSGSLYAVHPKELTELLKEVYAKTALTNPLHDKWSRISAMQAEVISWCQHLFGGQEGGYGLITHGGTTSIIEAMVAYVMHARAKGIKNPEIVVPATAHAAFLKAANLTGATLVTVPVNDSSGAVKASTMRRYLSGNTAVMVGSAPSFMYGIHDPISELGALALEYEIPFHVDACLGGFVTAFIESPIQFLDLRVPGVTSLSVDTHKYGCCPKGTSICLFHENSPALSVYAALNWPGGLYATPGILDGSTSGARVAELYATLSYYGYQGYQKIATEIIKLRREIQEKVSELPQSDIYIYGQPHTSVLGFRSGSLNPHFIADELDKKGWKLNLLQNPKGFHLCLTHVHTLIPDFCEKFIKDLKQAIDSVKSYPHGYKGSGNVKVYGAVGMMPTKIQQKVCEGYQKDRLHFVARNPSLFANRESCEQVNPDLTQLHLRKRC